jgi:glucose/arabinose dehydrogenase
MMRSRTFRAVICALALIPAGAVSASAGQPQGPPPPPTATNGNAVETLAQGVPTPTQFAFGAGKVFVAAAGSEDGSTPGGVFVVENGTATRLAGSPPFAFGIAWRDGTLYVSSGPQIHAWSGWNGTAFAQQRVIYTGPRGFPGFNGLAISPRNGRIYSGVSLDGRFDARLSPAPLANRVLSLKRDGTDVRTVTTGLRQPFMLAFVRGIKDPFGTHLGQENLGRNEPPDFIYRAHKGDNLGFPTCVWTSKRACKGFDKPVRLLPAHASPMGIGAIGSRLYVALFTGTGRGPEVISIRIGGKSRKQIKHVLTGYAAPVVALGTHDGWIYTGDVTGAIYRVEA